MKKETFVPNIFPHAIASGLIIAALLGTSYAQDKNPVVVDLAAVQKGIATLQTSVATTTTALENLRESRKSKEKLAGAHTVFAKELDNLEGQITALRAQATQMRARADDHYKAWQAELSKMGNPKLRDKAQNRFEDAKEEFDGIIAKAEEARRELVP